ncbi:hypothetical protein ASPSYDRAFT_46947 [Aspergillus sydowii CBS 593.65]|uniref:GTP-binding nuclear protein n=1 Tax=Aspergillus sydowii CBS 593.65 TaxID=1036612 RepID=A0A1L9TE85_9EURO|nr:uncharacterized protein ASPSYDRAFT_46947 [Aspergillus sydowii CBS 593.65]OJJ57738.1 hypothetical protein ASPSYDRAFT_46947 [Aspergillus sydowii CBS 593.65]
MSVPLRRLKVVLLGDAGVGKTSYMQRYARREFLGVYEPSYNAKFQSIRVQFTEGLVVFDIWDIPPDVPCDELIQGCDGAILMFDTTIPSTYESIPRHYATMLPILGCHDRVPIPVVVCGNNCGSPRRVVHPPMITFHREKGLQYYDFSVRELYNFHKPLKFLAWRVFGREMEYAFEPDVGEKLERERR